MSASVAKRQEQTSPDTPQIPLGTPYSHIVAAQEAWNPSFAPPVAYTESWVREIELPLPPFLIPGRIPYGIWSHSAPPGGYKSAFAAQLEHHIAWGTALPGPVNWITAQRGDCLVITPDESIDEIQNRSFRVTPGGSLDHDGQWQTAPFDIHIRHVPHGGDISLRIDWLWAEITQTERGTGRKIVWVRWDTLGSLLGDRGGVDHYTHAMPLQRLNFEFATSKRVLFLPNHIGKSGEPIGTVNITANSNLATITEMAEKQDTGVLKAKKMRGGALWERSLKAKNGLLELDDMLPQEASTGPSTLPGQVIAYLVKNGPSKSRDLISGTGIAQSSIWTVLRRLKTRDQVVNIDGLWQLVNKDAEPVPPRATEAAPAEWVWRHCPDCNNVEDQEWGCNNMLCARYNRDRPLWSASVLQLGAAELPAHVDQDHGQDQAHAGTPTDTPSNVQLPSEAAAPELPRWRQMSQRKSRPVEVPEINAAFEVGPKGQRFWEVRPITRAIDLIMADRDNGKLTPRWRVDLPDDLVDSLNGEHQWGEVPRRYKGEYRSKPAGPCVSYDVRGSYLASYKTLLAIKGLTEFDGTWGQAMTGAALICTPEWRFEDKIGHPLGAKAVPGTWQWVWQPSLRLLKKLADHEDKLIEFPEIRKMYMRPKKYQDASENLLVGFQEQMKAAREYYTEGPESDYIKLMYSSWLSSAEYGRSNVFLRGDWTYTVESEANGRGWDQSYRAVTAGVKVIAMGNKDETVFRKDDKLSTLYPQEKILWGKLKIKDEWD